MYCRFIYSIGGYDGSTALSVVRRAEILNPSESPLIISIDINVLSGVNSSFAPGFYSWVVSAVYDAAGMKVLNMLHF
jgi:hypothetical protein